MRILQLVDSLDAGGAERMAVNYANVLSEKIALSAISVTRKEGALKGDIAAKVPYLFLGRKRMVDFRALRLLRRFVKINNIEWVHAHGSSFFMAVLLKITYPKLKLVWHDHNGNRTQIQNLQNFFLVLCSFFFDAVITVNRELQSWAVQKLYCRKVLYLPNFTLPNPQENPKTLLEGNIGKRIVCLANLRHPKNHIVLIQAFYDSGLFSEGWTLHLVGKDSRDDYAETLRNEIQRKGLADVVFLLGSKTDVYHILQQADIGVLCSTYEGFPVTLLEYGLSNLAVISSDVGYCSEIITDLRTGFLFNPEEPKQLREKLLVLAHDEHLRKTFGTLLHQSVVKQFSQDAVIASYLNLIA